jgi:hypothetical protein
MDEVRGLPASGIPQEEDKPMSKKKSAAEMKGAPKPVGKSRAYRLFPRIAANHNEILLRA